MGSIPLPALHLNPPQPPPNVMEQYGQLLQMKNQMQNAPLQRQILQQQAQSGQMQLQQEQQGMKDQQAFRAAMSDPSMQGKTIGDVADALAKSGAISQQSWVAAKKADVEQRKSLADLTDKQLDNAVKATAANKQLLENVMSLPDDQVTQNWPQIVQQYNAIPGNEKRPLNPQQPLTKEQIQQQAPLLAVHQAYLDADLARREAQTKAKTEEATLGQKQAESQFYQQNGGAPGVSAELMQQSDWLKKNPGKGPSDYKLWVSQHSPTAIVMGNQFSPDAVNLAAQNLLQTGQGPQGMYRSPGTIAGVYNKAAEMNSQQGGPGIAANKATFQANETSLKSLQKNFDQVQAFEQTALSNINLLQSTAQKIPDLGTRFANVPVRMLNAKMLGTENMAAFNTALNTAQTEAAKVLNSSNATGVLSDSARHELQQIIDGNLPYKSMVASLNTLKQDMGNRTAAYQKQIGDIQGRIRGTAPAASALTVTAPNGKVYTFKDQASADAFKQKAGIQ